MALPIHNNKTVHTIDFLEFNKMWLEGTTKEAMDKLAEMFRANNQNEPRNGKYWKQDLQTQLILIFYKNKDPVTNQERSFTLFFLH